MGLITKDIENHVIYSDGRIWSKRRNRFMKPSINGHGYLQTRINGKPRTIHRIIAETFIPNPNNLPFIDHINNDKTDNRIENLRWCTNEQNTIWAWEDELCKPLKGESVGNSKLKESEVIEIYTNPNKLSLGEFSEIFGISKMALSKIQNDENWAHITKHLTPGYRNKRGGMKKS